MSFEYTPFAHTPFKFPDLELRLLVLEPGKEGADLHCQLTTVASVSARNYEALSYCWGTGESTVRIFVCGKAMQVMPNLEHALKNLRREKRHRVIWADAICINQSDISEKNQQVLRMRIIYENATRVLIWIGRAHEDQDELLDWSYDIWGFDRREPGSPDTTRNAFALAREMASELHLNAVTVQRITEGLNVMNREAFADLSRLLRRDWFERLWTIQEVVLAKRATIVCGLQTLPWKVLEDFNRQIYVTLTPHLTNPDSVAKYGLQLGVERVERIADCSRYRSLLALLHSIQVSPFPQLSVRTTDNRDRLFGLMGMAQGPVHFEVDYTKETKSVYQAWVTRSIAHGGNLDVLSLCCDTAQYGGPSWIPELTREINSDEYLAVTLHKSSMVPPTTTYRAAGSWLSLARFTGTLAVRRLKPEPQPTLHISVLRLGTISILQPVDERTSNDDGCTQQRCHELENLLMLTGPAFQRRCASGETFDAKLLHEEFATTLFRGYRHPRVPHGNELLYEIWRGRADRPPPPNQLTTREHLMLLNFPSLVCGYISGAQMFTSSAGQFGVISSFCHVREDDEVFILRGGKTPFVLRQNSDGSYRLLGPCYVYGAMDGTMFIDGWLENREYQLPRSGTGWIREIAIV